VSLTDEHVKGGETTHMLPSLSFGSIKNVEERASRENDE